MHSFLRNSSSSYCHFCKNTWGVSDSVVSTYYSCQTCDYATHSACKNASTLCIPCGSLASPITPSGPFKGTLQVKIKHAYDIGNRNGVLLYGLWKFAGVSCRSENSAAGANECIWMGGTGQPSQLPISLSEDVGNNGVQFELWTSYLGIFDQVIARTSFSVQPAAWHPNSLIERWFDLDVMDPASISKGKILLELVFIPSSSSSADRTRSNSSSSSKVKEIDKGWFSMLRGDGQSGDYDASGVIESTPFSSYVQPVIEAEEKAAGMQEAVADVVAIHAGSSKEGHNAVSEWTEKTMSSLGNWLFELESESGKQVQMEVQQPEPIHIDARTKAKVDAASSSSLAQQPAAEPSPSPMPSSQPIKVEKDKHAGLVSLSIVSACLLDRAASGTGAADGYYLQVAAADSSKILTSHTVYDSSSPIFNVQYSLSVAHYRTMVTISLVDAKSKRKLGECLLWPYLLMQREADQRIEHRSEGSKSSSKGLDQLSLVDSNGADIGYLLGTASFSENMEQLYWSPTPAAVSSSPAEEMAIDRLQQHVARFTSLIDWFSDIYSDYLYIMSWQDPILTSALFLLFLYCTLYIQAEYQLSGILFVNLLLMTRTLWRRKTGGYRMRCIARGPKQVAPSYRPISTLKIALLGLRHKVSSNSAIRRPLLRVSYVPMQEHAADGAAVATAEHFIGFLGSDASHTERGSFLASFLKPDLSKPDHLLHNVLDIWPCPQLSSSELVASEGVSLLPQREICLLYPILQPPLKAVAGSIGMSNDSSHSTDSVQGPGQLDLKLYLPWELNEGHLKLELAHDPGTFLEADKEYLLLPLKQIARRAGQGEGAYEMLAWMRCADSLQAAQAALEDPGEILPLVSPRKNSMTGHTELLLRASLLPADAQSSFTPKPTEIQNSALLQQALQPGSKDQSTLAVLWNLRDYIKYVQNIMAWLLDLLESYKNLLNWTQPSKSYPLYALLASIWVLTICIPGRYLILAIGLYQFFYILLPIPDSDEWYIKWNNFIHSIPNDDDLDAVYSKERKKHVEQLALQKKQLLQHTLLNLTLPVRWSGQVQIKSSADQRAWHAAHLMLQGHRLLWYRSQEELDTGKASIGQLLLTNVASLTPLSPVDIRERVDEARLLAVFGQDSAGKPLKLSLELASRQEKMQLEGCIRSSIASLAST